MDEMWTDVEPDPNFVTRTFMFVVIRLTPNVHFLIGAHLIAIKGLNY